MPDLREASVRNLDPAQAAELSVLVELEARWENLRRSPSRPKEAGPSTQELQSKQKAYEAFHVLLRSYNKRYTPAHVPELLLNTPARLGLWCRAMAHLFNQVGDHPRAHNPVHLVEKAYRWADRVADRVHVEHVRRPAPPESIRAAIGNLEELARWCEDLAAVPAIARSA
jgi:hypothetical protein